MKGHACKGIPDIIIKKWAFLIPLKTNQFNETSCSEFLSHPPRIFSKKSAYPTNLMTTKPRIFPHRQLHRKSLASIFY